VENQLNRESTNFSFPKNVDGGGMSSKTFGHNIFLPFFIFVILFCPKKLASFARKNGVWLETRYFY
jgi:hypothetical protein